MQSTRWLNPMLSGYHQRKFVCNIGMRVLQSENSHGEERLITYPLHYACQNFRRRNTQLCMRGTICKIIKSYTDAVWVWMNIQVQCCTNVINNVLCVSFLVNIFFYIKSVVQNTWHVSMVCFRLHWRQEQDKEIVTLPYIRGLTEHIQIIMTIKSACWSNIKQTTYVKSQRQTGRKQ